MALLQLILCSVLTSGCGGGDTGLDDPDTQPSTNKDVFATGVLPGTPAAAALAGPGAAAPPMRIREPVRGAVFDFTLSAARSTSAAVYAADGTLLRTLWRGERLAAGLHSRNWDHRDDAGKVLPAGEYTVRVVHHDVNYVWEGVVGNSSSSGLAPTALHRAFGLPTSLASAAGQMHYSVGYNEAQELFHGFTPGQPQHNLSPVRWFDPFVAAGMIAVDGDRLYWANTGGLAGRSFVAAFELASGKQAVFSFGMPVCLNLFPGSTNCYPQQNYASVLDLRKNMSSPPTGLAVQRNGRLLAVAYGVDNAVRLFDKQSGQLLRVMTVPLKAGTQNQLAFTASGDLWVLGGTQALRYTNLSAAPVLAATAGGLVNALAVTADPQDEDSVWVADGGSSQQLKRYDREGVLKTTLGRAGGMADKAIVASDRLCFRLGPDVETTAIAVDMQRALWVVDTCNNRMLRLHAGGQVLDSIAYLPAVYTATTDLGNPTRVFANFLEFAVDYAKPLSDPQAWTLVRNWLPALPAELRDERSANRAFGGLQQVLTMSNGRAYAMMTARGRQHLLELLADGSVRLVQTFVPPAASASTPVLYEDGELGHAVTEGKVQTVLRRALQGFDAQGNPQWAQQPAVVASVPLTDSTPHFRNGTFSGGVGARFPLTASGRVVFFNPAVDTPVGFHLGAAVRGGRQWLWQASPSGALDGRGAFQTKKQDPAIQYGGNTVQAQGRHILYGYHGEFYTDLGNRRVGQANQFMHFRDDGLFIGQFGVASTRATSPTQAGLSGNAFSPTLVRAAGRSYLYHNDESTQGGVHRWRLDGLDGIQELSAAVRSGTRAVLR